MISWCWLMWARVLECQSLRSVRPAFHTLALSASDRPYKPMKTLSQCLKSMLFVVKGQEIDTDVLRVFILSGRWKAYGEKFLRSEQCDDIDIDGILSLLAA